MAKKKQTAGNERQGAETINDFTYSTDLAKKVVFSITFCSTDRDYSFHRVDRQQAEDLVNKLQHFSNFGWGDFERSVLQRDRRDSHGFKKVDMQKPKKMLTEYYGHFPIGGDGIFRTFGFRDDNVFHITHIDRSGKIYRKAHK